MSWPWYSVRTKRASFTCSAPRLSSRPSTTSAGPTAWMWTVSATGRTSWTRTTTTPRLLMTLGPKRSSTDWIIKVPEYYKAVRPDGTDFYTGRVDYAAHLASGAVGLCHRRHR